MQGPSDQAGAHPPDGDCHTRGLRARNDEQVFSHSLPGVVNGAVVTQNLIFQDHVSDLFIVSCTL